MSFVRSLARPSTCPVPAPDGSEPARTVETLLLVGFKGARNPALPDWLAARGGRQIAVAFQSLSPALIRQMRPSQVVSPLFTDSFDAIELARKLDRIGYRGRYTVLAPTLPDPTIVTREICEQSPNLDFELISGTPVQAF